MPVTSLFKGQRTKLLQMTYRRETHNYGRAGLYTSPATRDLEMCSADRGGMFGRGNGRGNWRRRGRGNRGAHHRRQYSDGSSETRQISQGSRDGRGGRGGRGNGFNWQRFRDRSLQQTQGANSESQQILQSLGIDLNSSKKLFAEAQMITESKDNLGQDPSEHQPGDRKREFMKGKAERHADRAHQRKQAKIYDVAPETIAIPSEDIIHLNMLSHAITSSVAEQKASTMHSNFSPSQFSEMPLEVEKGRQVPAVHNQERGRKAFIAKEQSAIDYDDRASKEMKEFRKGLPAYRHRQGIIDKLRVPDSQILVLSGETGSGKTTQIPQYILEDYRERGEYCNIICTQPRRLTTIGVAERVAEEIGQKVGNTVGYQIRLDKTTSEDTRLLYCTTGVLLRKLLLDPTLEKEGVTHLILDEAHERSVETDFLLIIVKRLLKQRKDFKVVVMSATLNSEQFVDYFSGQQVEQRGHVPTFEIEGRMFPVKEYFLEDAIELVGASAHELSADTSSGDQRSSSGRKPSFKKSQGSQQSSAEEGQVQRILLEDPTLSNGDYSEGTRRALLNGFGLNDIPYPLISKLITKLVAKELQGVRDENNAILVFLPGWMEIKAANEALSSMLTANQLLQDVEVFILHSMVGAEQQRLVFKKSNRLKIILSTNIAESSITISEVKYVIDSCKVKEMSYDHDSKIGVLSNQITTRDRLKQRRGRAGRVSEGVCFHLLPRSIINSEFTSEYSDPEILRTPLEQLCLQIKALGDTGEENANSLDVKSFLSEALSPPTTQSVENAIALLENLGALKIDTDENIENLSWLGRILACLPLSPQIGKILLLSLFFDCLDPILTLAAVLSQKSVFVNPIDSQAQRNADRQRQNLSNGYPSDHYTVLQAFHTWDRINSKSYNDGRMFAKTNYMSYSALRNIKELRDQFLTILKDAGLIQHSKDALSTYGKNNTNWSVIKACLISGLYPNLLRQDPSRRSISFFERDNGDVKLHPSSIVSKQLQNVNFKHKFLLYFEKMRTDTGVYVFDVSQISPLPILMFCGNLSVSESFLPSSSFKGKLEQELVLKYINEVIAKRNGTAELKDLSRVLRPLVAMKSRQLREFLNANKYTLQYGKTSKNSVHVSLPEAGAVQELNPLFRLQFTDSDWIYFDTQQEELFSVLQEARTAFDTLLHNQFNSRHTRNEQGSIASNDVADFKELLSRLIVHNADDDDSSQSLK